jgi:hypothetical protein
LLTVVTLALAGALSVGVPVAAAGGTVVPVHTQRVTASDGTPGADFGHGVAIDNDTAIVGAPEAAVEQVAPVGAAYVYTRDATTGQWTEQAKLNASDPHRFSLFGHSVALDGDRAVVLDASALRSVTSRAYVFERGPDGAWSQVAKVRGEEDVFSNDVDLEGDRFVVGANRDDNVNGERAGAAFVFERNQTGAWQQAAKLVADEGQAYAYLGFSVSLDGDLVAAGAPFEDTEAGRSGGSVAVFQASSNGTWTQTARLVSPQDEAPLEFGWSVALDDGALLVGAPTDSTPNGPYSGSAYVWQRTAPGAWSIEAHLMPVGPGADEVGVSVALEDGIAIVGEGGDLAPEPASGSPMSSAYVFARQPTGLWVQQPPPVPAGVPLGAWEVATDGDRALVGEPTQTNLDGQSAGGGHFFRLVNADPEDAVSLIP